MELYHYRSIERALLEIEEGTFHFSSREELNDPLEGYLRVYWQGDVAAWEGLLRNFICSLFINICDNYLSRQGILIYNQGFVRDLCQFDNKPIKSVLEALGNQFLEIEDVRDVAETFGKSECKCYSLQLICAFQFIYPLALKMCFESCLKNQIIADTEAKELIAKYGQGFAINDSKVKFSDFFEKNNKQEKDNIAIIKVMEDIITDMSEFWLMGLDFDKQDVLYKQEDRSSSNTLINKRNRDAREWIKCTFEFPNIYLEELKEMLYPRGFFVCFSANNDISPMWGNYADNHKGACLIYKTDENQTLKVNVRFSGFRSLSAKKVLYGGEVTERNFFETLGRLTYPQIIKWLTGKQGISRCYDAFKYEDEWRKKYWETFEIKNYRKLVSWSYENEYRLQITDMFYDMEDTAKRNFQYDPQSLKGIVFGIRTSEYDKKRLYNALLGKKEQLKGFSFYQAEYDEDKQKIRIRKKANWLL